MNDRYTTATSASSGGEPRRVAPTIDRRTFLERTGVVGATLALAGCAGTGGDGSVGDDDGDDPGSSDDSGVDAVPQFVAVEDPPAAVYVPTHREAMRALEPIEAGDVAIAPMLSYPHRFWTIAGGGEDALQRVDPSNDRGVHLMVTLWDRETGTVLPADEGVQVRIEHDGEPVGTPFSPWAMISQEMGVHFGDNVSLPEDGTYAVEVEVPPLSTPTTGALAGRLTDPVRASFEFVYDDEFREAVVGGVEYLDEADWGRRGALRPMGHGGDDGDGHGDHDDHDDHAAVPYSALPPVEAFPGTILVEPGTESTPSDTRDLSNSGDARFLTTLLESDHRLASDGERYLLVSVRTPYNRVPLPDASLLARFERGEEDLERRLEQRLDGEFGLHYGADAPTVEPGETVTIEVESPPQVARHQGYETAFLEMSPIELTVPEGSR